MTANRYLLNDSPQQAIELYRRALAEEQVSSGVRCHLIVACLNAGRLNEAVSELLWLIDQNGVRVMNQLPQRCTGFLDEKFPPDPKERRVQSGLRHLLHGRWREALDDLKSDADGSSKQLVRLIDWLENQLRDDNKPVKPENDVDPVVK